MTNQSAYESFNRAIDDVAKELGGSKGVRRAVADLFKSKLLNVIADRIGEKSYNIDFTYGADVDLQAAISDTYERVLPIRATEPVRYEASYTAQTLFRLRGGNVWMEGNGRAILIISSDPDPKTGKTMLFLSKSAEIIARENSYASFSGRKTAVHVKTGPGVDRSIIQMVQAFFGASLAPIVQEAA